MSPRSGAFREAVCGLVLRVGLSKLPFSTGFLRETLVWGKHKITAKCSLHGLVSAVGVQAWSTYKMGLTYGELGK